MHPAGTLMRSLAGTVASGSRAGPRYGSVAGSPAVWEARRVARFLTAMRGIY